MARIKEGFKGERLIPLSEELLASYQREPLIDNLCVHEIGLFLRIKYHFLQKEYSCDYAALTYCTRGEEQYHVFGKQYTVEKYQYIIIPPGIPYSFGANKEDSRAIYWLHSRGRPRNQFSSLHPVPVTILPSEYPRPQDRLRLLEEIYSSFSTGYIKEYMIYSSTCLYNSLAFFIYLEQSRHIVIPSQKEYPFTARVIHYMRENIRRNPALEELAFYFKYSPSHFSALFFGETEISPMNYFIRLKIQKACECTELTDMKLSEIATRLGFEDAVHFSRMFTRVISCSPSAYCKKEMKI